MTFLANLGRVVASHDILPSVDSANATNPSVLMLLLSADMHWRQKNWQTAIEAASRVLDRKPRHFHALTIITTSYGHLKQFDTARLYAKQLVLVSLPPWIGIKIALTILTFWKLFTSKGRSSYRRLMQRCDMEAQADRDALTWARELVREAANDPATA